jgi:phosphoenolpyruvate carboxykinase (GTP)
MTIVGDDLAYLRIIDGEIRSVNVESGIFGIIQDVNPVDDPVIYEVIVNPREVIYSNVLVVDDMPYWEGMGQELPKAGLNYSGDWVEGKLYKEKKVAASHANARFTIRLRELPNVDPALEDPRGVVGRAIIYGGRDSDTSVPVAQALSWNHGVFVGASLESEATATILQGVGQRKINPMANIEFIVVPLGEYLTSHFRFGNSVADPPLVFGTNYFIKNADGRYLSEKVDKKVWLLWMEGRVHGIYDAIETPVGYIPKYEDLRVLFDQVFQRPFSPEAYTALFSIRIAKYLEKLERVKEWYSKEQDLPSEFTQEFEAFEARLQAAKAKHGDVASPEAFL